MGMTRPRFIAPRDCWTPAALTAIRSGLDLAACGLVAVDNADAWELLETCHGGPHHAWRHRETSWASQTLTVPQWCLDAPAKARAELMEQVSPLAVARMAQKRKKTPQDERLVS